MDAVADAEKTVKAQIGKAVEAVKVIYYFCSFVVIFKSLTTMQFYSIVWR